MGGYRVVRAGHLHGIAASCGDLCGPRSKLFVPCGRTPGVSRKRRPRQPIVGRITLIPLGLQCEFTSMTGRAMTLKPDVVLTAMLATSAASVLAAGLVLVQGNSRRRVLLDAQRRRENSSETV